MLNPSIQKGRTLVITIIAVVLLMSLLNMAFVGAIAPEQTTIKDGIRLVFTVVLCYFLYQGYGWARWVLGVLLAVGGLIAIPSVLLVIQISFFGAVWLLAMGIVFLGCSWVLLRSPEIKAFLVNQRAR